MLLPVSDSTRVVRGCLEDVRVGGAERVYDITYQRQHDGGRHGGGSEDLRLTAIVRR